MESFFRDHLEESFRLRPMEATRLGDHRDDQQLDDLSAAAREGWREQYRRRLQDLPEAVDVERLSPAGQDRFRNPAA